MSYHCATRGRPLPNTQGLTLLELLIALTVVGFLAGMLIQAIGTVRASAQAAVCKNTLRQAYLANLGYSNDFKGYIAPSAMAFTNRPTVELPWSYFVASYADRTGYGGKINREIVPEIAICKPFISRYPDLVDWTETSVGNVRAWGFVRNPLLAASNGSTTGAIFGKQDSSTFCDPITGAQKTANFFQFRWLQVTNPSSRLFLGEGYYESAGQLHAFIVQTGVTTTAAALKYQYTYQWGGSVNTAKGLTVKVGTGTPQSPAGATSDLHRGKRSYVMCDGSARALTDRYDDPRNQVFLSITDPQSLP